MGLLPMSGMTASAVESGMGILPIGGTTVSAMESPCLQGQDGPATQGRAPFAKGFAAVDRPCHGGTPSLAVCYPAQ